MGLLDDLLGQLTGNATTQHDRGTGMEAQQGASPGMGAAMAALLPVVLAMLRGGGGGGGAQQASLWPSGGGGLGDLLERFGRAGYGDQVTSWVGTGRNMPLPADALDKVFGRGGLAEIARRAGLSEQDTSRGLSQLMPEVVDRVTPDGQVPAADSLLASVDALAKRLGA